MLHASFTNMRIAIITDAWQPQVNGVVQTLTKTREELINSGHNVLPITPLNRRTMPCPTYPEIRLSIMPARSVTRELDDFEPEGIHIATEGPLGMAARRYCIKRQRPFITSYHTQFPEYLRARAPIPIAATARALRWFHDAAERTLVPTEKIREKLCARGFRNVVIWSRGVDSSLFNPTKSVDYKWPRPIWIHMGRISVEKNIEDFLNLELPGTKVVIGDGPDRARLEKRYRYCRFLGYKFGAELAAHLAGGDVFVFPSKTDTFGLVMLEAMGCGLPVAAYPVDGPVDVVRHGETGILDFDLRRACQRALKLDPADCRKFAEGRSWANSTAQFEKHLVSTTSMCAAP